jgi:predicted glycogen debranching enzyme
MDKTWTTHAIPSAGNAADASTYCDRHEMRQREWLLTNGTGAFAMGTALGGNTRRYHGLLIAAERPPVGRVVALNQLFDRLVLSAEDGDRGEPQTVELGTCLFRGESGDPQADHDGYIYAPQGHRVLAGFRRGLTVAWTYRWGKIEIERELILHDHQQAATVRYRVTGLKTLQADATLLVSPMLTLRDFHGLLRRGDAFTPFDTELSRHARQVTVRHNDTAVTLAADAGRFTQDPDWWHGIAYPLETHRGQGDTEDYFVPGKFELPLKANSGRAEVTLTVALGPEAAEPKVKPGRAPRLRKALASLPGEGALQHAFALAADDFVVQRTVRGKKLTTIMAGYPWFADWGRDTFIALTGLLLTAGRFNEARDVLRAFADAIQNGLVPNRFDDYEPGKAHYNTVDASLWFVEAALQYAHETDRQPPWLVKAIRQIVVAYRDGTAAQGHDGRPVPIAMDDDHLIAAGDDHSQLTWMDAACGGTVFTPRPGKCVEINALWYAALVGLSELLSDSDPDAAEHYDTLAGQVKNAFIKTFWSDDLKRLIDHVRPDGEPDLTLRPNMVFACSLHHSPLPPALRKATLAAIKHSLLTPLGLRTLPADDPNYHAHYGGPQYDRDRAYHQGTVWPWLLGPYAEGVLRAGNFSAKTKIQVRALLQPLSDHLLGEGLGQLPEIVDAGEPHHPRGCPAQAWSVAELLRVSALLDAE